MSCGMEVSLTALFAVGLAWTVKRNRRRLPATRLLLDQLQQSQLVDLNQFIDFADDLLDDDPIFWAKSGGTAGLVRRRSNAVCLVQLCQHFCNKAALRPEVMAYMTRRASLMTLFVAISFLGTPIRFMFTGLPHIAALIATRLYADIARRAKTICLDYRDLDPLVADRILALL